MPDRRHLFRTALWAVGLVCVYGCWRRLTVPDLTLDAAWRIALTGSIWQDWAMAMAFIFVTAPIVVVWWISEGGRHEREGRKMPLWHKAAGCLAANPVFWTFLVIPCIYVQSSGPNALPLLLLASLALGVRGPRPALAPARLVR